MRAEGRANLGDRYPGLFRRRVVLCVAAFAVIVAAGISGCTGTASQSGPVPQLVVTPDTVNFANVTVGQKNTQTLRIANAGKTTLTIDQIQVSSASFTVSAPALPASLAPGAALNITLAFAPQTPGGVSATLMISSADLPSPETVPVQGNAQLAHSVKLSWNASASAVNGYYVYRAGSSNGPFTRLTVFLLAGLSYTDSTVVSGNSYTYYVTAVDGAGAESAPSNETVATIPSP